ncbi:hypothetical protein TeGR_g8973 [Tetraparma gracilis]|uniref:Hflx-type G domain-containing protein n=1 Tax=Tetraparma gracilis TaxID=2962635 RepID=A0ABQ6M8W7_9STRA|nr:hypothetical protein TeGR_g8973 [Tetraparma gracilis]
MVGVEDLSYHRNKNTLSPSLFSLEESLAELSSLVSTAGLTPVASLTQRLNDPNPRTYIGTGKVKEIREACEAHETCTVVFDNELSPRQLKHLENEFGGRDLSSDKPLIKVLDRTALILDIFAQRALTREGQLQVQLALQVYRAPRLTKLWTHLERQSGGNGVGLRGPGERQLEIDKRLMRDRITELKKEIDAISSHRSLHRKKRSQLNLPVVSIVGYTNAGKSTLMNLLSASSIYADDLLFATLDPTTRRADLGHIQAKALAAAPPGTPPAAPISEILLTDTVGFIQKLPTTLVAAFRATLEEVAESDVLVHVIDVSSDSWEKREQSVLDTLEEINAGGKPVVRVLNKIDAVPYTENGNSGRLRAEAMMLGTGEDTVAVSAKTGEGAEDFVECLRKALQGLLKDIEVVIPYSKGEDVNAINEVGVVDKVDYRENGTYIRGKVPPALFNSLAKWAVDESSS